MGVTQLKLLEEAVGAHADIRVIAEDIGDSSGTIFGPDLWREI